MKQVFAILSICVVAALSGCARPADPSLAARFQDEDPCVRIAAIMQAANTNDSAALPFLVDRLTDSESDVRVYAITALRRVTGQTMGYHHYDPPVLRAQAVGRWREWLQSRPGDVAASRPTSEPSNTVQAMEGKR